MSFQLLAALRTDGSGLVRESGKIYLYKPPFTLGQKTYVTEDEYNQGVVHYGFTEINQSFLSINQVVKYLNDMVWEARRKAGDNKIYSKKESYLDYLKSIPAVLLPSSIEKLEEYLTENRFQGVLPMAEGLLKNPRLDSFQKEKLLEILQQATQSKDNLTTLKNSIFSISTSVLQKAKDFSQKLTPNSIAA